MTFCLRNFNCFADKNASVTYRQRLHLPTLSFTFSLSLSLSLTDLRTHDYIIISLDARTPTYTILSFSVLFPSRTGTLIPSALMKMQQGSREKPEPYGENRTSKEEQNPKIETFQNDLTSHPRVTRAA